MDDSVGRGERQARALVMVVIVIEALWIFFHKYLPLDAALWSLQADAMRLHLAGSTHDGLQMIPLPAANVLVSFVSGILSFLFSGEVVVRMLLVGIGFLARGFAMLSLLRVLKVREALVYFLVPVFVWSGVFFIGSVPYLVGETVAIALVSFFLSQDRPRAGAYYILMIGFAVVALCHALAFFAVALITFAVANEQRRSVHLSQGWLSNFNRVVGLVIPGCIVLLLRFLAPGPIFMLSTSGFLPSSPVDHFLMTLSVSPHIKEAGFPGSDILTFAVTVLVVLLSIASLIRAFLLPMEEVSWQSRSAKKAGGILLVASLLCFAFLHISVETNAFLWMAVFFVTAGSYSRGPAVRRGAVDRLLRTLGFIAMAAAGLINGLGTNRGSEAASDLREASARLVQGERGSAREDMHIDSIDVHFVIDSAVTPMSMDGLQPEISYSATAMTYLYLKGASVNLPSRYQPRAGMLEREDGRPLTTPASVLSFPQPADYFEPRLRVLALLPDGTGTSSSFGQYAYGIKDTSGFVFSRADASFHLVIGRLRSEPQMKLAFK